MYRNVLVLIDTEDIRMVISLNDIEIIAKLIVVINNKVVIWLIFTNRS